MLCMLYYVWYAMYVILCVVYYVCYTVYVIHLSNKYNGSGSDPSWLLCASRVKTWFNSNLRSKGLQFSFTALYSDQQRDAMVTNNANSVQLALTDKDMKDPEPFLKAGEKWKIDYDFFIMIRERVRGSFRRCNMDICTNRCVPTHAYPATIGMLNTMDP